MFNEHFHDLKIKYGVGIALGCSYLEATDEQLRSTLATLSNSQLEEVYSYAPKHSCLETLTVKCIHDNVGLTIANLYKYPEEVITSITSPAMPEKIPA